ncbi:hypothetical protein Tco_0218995 [Tanacetum coccineum]
MRSMRLLLSLSSCDLCLYLRCRLVPSCFAIFDLEPLTLSLDFVLMYEIFKSLSFHLDRLCHLVILCLDQHAHALHHLESLLTTSPRSLISEELSLISEFARNMCNESTSVGMRAITFPSYVSEIKQLAIKRGGDGEIVIPTLVVMYLSCLLEEQLLEPALNVTVHCFGREFRLLNCMIEVICRGRSEAL